MTRIINISLEDICSDFSPLPAPKKPKHEPYISRLPVVPGWEVQAEALGVPIQFQFLDKTFGSKRYALDAATSWRDAQLWYAPSWGSAPSVNPIRRYQCPAAGGSAIESVWYASGVDIDGGKWIAKYSVDFWGEEIAMHKAVHARDSRQWDLEAAAASRSRRRSPAPKKP